MISLVAYDNDKPFDDKKAMNDIMKMSNKFGISIDDIVQLECVKNLCMDNYNIRIIVT